MQEQFLVDRKEAHRSETRKAKSGGLFERSCIDRRTMVPQKTSAISFKTDHLLIGQFLRSQDSRATDVTQNVILNTEIAFPNFAVFP